MSRKLTLTLPKEGAQILITHTHAEETYWNYKKDGVSVVEAGDHLAEMLTAQGFSVIHDRTDYSKGDFYKSYSSALAGITAIKKKNPGIAVVIDLHRDAVQAADGTFRKPVAEVDGRKAAQMMFVMGTNNNLPHDDWAKNLCLAVQLQKKLTDTNPDLMRPINLRKERFNEHVTTGSMILECGAFGNDSSEALYSLELFAKAAGEVLKALVK
jgi:stage II sporulation protein P